MRDTMGTRKVLILGGTGMLGHTLFIQLSKAAHLEVYATIRNPAPVSRRFPPELTGKIIDHVDAYDFAAVTRAIDAVQPDVVINCIGLIKQLPAAGDPQAAISINALLPHRISSACRAVGARMIHISTDCVFDGKKGNYKESDHACATDLYGRTKFLGEVSYPHCVTLRTSIIGHELKGKVGLIEWFLAREEAVRGFTNAIYTGFPTVEMAHIIKDFVIPNPDLEGVYHVSSDPITKYDLLKLVAQRYVKQIAIEPYPDVKLDRSLDSSLFRGITGYAPPPWPELVDKMYKNYISSTHYN